MLQHISNLANLCLHAGVDHYSTPSPIGNHTARVCHVRPVSKGNIFAGKGFCLLFDRERLTRQRGFHNLQIDCLSEPQVSRYYRTCLKNYHIAGDKITCCQLSD